MQAPNSPGLARSMGSLDRLDSLDEYFLLNSPPDSPAQTRGMDQSTQGHTPNFEMYSYYPGHGESILAPQGNVKQSTSYISVDRSNAIGQKDSIGFGRMMSSTQRDIDEMLKLDDKDLNLTELFLRCNHRQSLNQNYQAKGALNGHDIELHRTRSNSLSSSLFEDSDRIVKKSSSRTSGNLNGSNQQVGKNNSSKEDNSDDISLGFDLDVEPTPLSEIKAKSEERKRMQDEATRHHNGQSTQPEQAGSSGGLTSQKLDQHEYEQQRQIRQHHGGSYYPYGRSYQLPIPTMPPSSPPGTHSRPLSDAVATAAALASVQGSEDTTRAANTASNSPYQHGRTPPHSPSPRPTGKPSWQSSDGSRSNTPHAQSHSPSAATQQHHAYSINPHGQPHRGHSPYSTAPHHLATPLAVGSVPPGGIPPPKIVGPYTTAQLGGGSSSRRRTVTSTNSATTTASADSDKKVATTSSYLPRRGDHTTREAAAAHTQPKGVLTEAANQRRGHIGFHKPATSQTTSTYHHPLPSKFPNYGYMPPNTAIKTPTQTTSTPAPIAQKPAPLQNTMDPLVSSQPSIIGSNAATANQPTADTAYERKKQRAKDARVKLNESIERLHVAMGLAGTESKKRTEQLRHFMKQAGREHENNTDHQAFQLMDSCIKTAESAKKWDRPNFVGSAATLIECLNSQCEILMKELMEYQNAGFPVQRPSRPSPPNQDKDSDNNGSSRKDTSNCKNNASRTGEMLGEHGETQDTKGEKRCSDSDQEALAKRRKIEANGHCEDEKKESSAASDAETNPIRCP